MFLGFLGFFIGLAPIVVALISTAVSIGAQAIMSAVMTPKQKEPESRINGSAMGRNIPEIFNTYPIDGAKWVEPKDESRMFVPRKKKKEYQNYFAGISVLATCRGGAFIVDLFVFGEYLYSLEASLELTNNLNSGAIYLIDAKNQAPRKGQKFLDEEVSFNEGLPNQLPFKDWIEEYGVENLNPYRGIVTIGFYSLGVHEHGNTPPSVKVILRSNEVFTVGDILKKKCLDAGIAEDKIDISEVAGLLTKGYAIDSNGNSYYSELEELLINKFVAPVELNTGVISFRTIKRNIIKLDIPFYHLKVRDEGSGDGYFIKRSFKNLQDLPSFIIFTFLDPLRDYERNTVYTNPHPQATSTNSEHITTSEVLEEGEATAIATKLLYQMYDRLITYNFTTLYEYTRELQPLDVVTIGGQYTIQITEINEKSDYSLEITGFDYKSSSIEYSIDDDVYQSETPEESFDDFEGMETAIQDGEIYMLDIPLGFNSAQELLPYIYKNYIGTLWLSRNNEPYQEVYTAENADIYGNCTTVLGFETKDINGTSYPINTNLDSGAIFDSTSTLDIILTNGIMRSLTSDEFSDESVLMWVGKKVNNEWQGEYICAQVSLDLGDGKYRLSDLKRGLRGTEYYIDKHEADEMIFVLFENSESTELIYGDINRLLKFKILHSDEQDLNDVAENETFYLAKGITSYCPTDFAATDLGNGDIEFTFTKRPRYGNLQLGEQDIYHISIRSSVGNEIRLIEKDANNRYIYYLADRNADAIGLPLNIDAYKLNEINGRSNPNYIRDLPVI